MYRTVLSRTFVNSFLCPGHFCTGPFVSRTFDCHSTHICRQNALSQLILTCSRQLTNFSHLWAGCTFLEHTNATPSRHNRLLLITSLSTNLLNLRKNTPISNHFLWITVGFRNGLLYIGSSAATSWVMKRDFELEITYLSLTLVTDYPKGNGTWQWLSGCSASLC